MTRIKSGLLVLFCLALMTGGCGYYFPHIYEGPARTVYMPNWKNRTNQLGLDAKIYQALAGWFQKSKSITMTKKREQADLILAGEIVSIDLPSVAWGGDARTTDVKVKLGVRYVLKDLKTDKLLWEVPHQIWTEDYSTRYQGLSGEKAALAQIIDDLAEKIYLGTLERLRKQNLAAGK